MLALLAYPSHGCSFAYLIPLSQIPPKSPDRKEICSQREPKHQDGVFTLAEKREERCYDTVNVIGADIISPAAFFTIQRTVYVPAKSPV